MSSNFSKYNYKQARYYEIPEEMNDSPMQSTNISKAPPNASRNHSINSYRSERREENIQEHKSHSKDETSQYRSERREGGQYRASNNEYKSQRRDDYYNNNNNNNNNNRLGRREDNYRDYRSQRIESSNQDYQEYVRENIRDKPRDPRAYRDKSPRSYRDSPDRRNYRDSHRPHQKFQRENYRPQGPSYNDKNRVPTGPSHDRSRYESSYKPKRDTYKEQPREPELSKEELIPKYERKLELLTSVPRIEGIKVIGSQWGVKPKGFENVTAQRAKLSGLFPLPGYPRPVDFTKLEGVVKSRLMNSNDILIESSKIDPIDSRNSKILIIKQINFEKINYLKIVEFFNDFLKKIDIEERSTNNIENKRKTNDDQNLIIEFKNNTCATIVMALNGIKLSYNEFREDEREELKDEEIILNIERPGEYVVQCLPPYNEIKYDDIEDKVIDNPRKITLIVSPDLTETEIITELKKIAPIKGFQLLREVGTKQSLGIAFIEFFIDPTLKTITAIPIIQRFIEDLKNQLCIKNAFFSCFIPNKTSIQDCPIDFNTLKTLVKNENVSTHPKSKVIQLINIVAAKDLMDDSNFKFIEHDIKEELSKFGNVVSIKIPRPANDYTPGLIQFSQRGLGKVFVEFEDEETALSAIMGSAGRSYNDRTVLCAFFDYEDYKNGLL